MTMNIDLHQRKRHAGHILYAAACIVGLRGFKFIKANRQARVNYPTVYAINGEGQYITQQAVFDRLHELGVRKQRATVFRSIRLGEKIDGYEVTIIGRYDRQCGRMEAA